MAEDEGTDVGGVEDVDPAGNMVSGRRALAEALARRYQTPRGRLIGNPNYGEDLTEHINDDMTSHDLAAMQAAAIQEGRKEERVLDIQVGVELDVDGNVTVAITVTDADGPFDLTLSVSSLSVTLLSVGA